MSSSHRIKALDPLVSNQIAAGEVIERPASVLKELIENSLDAKATEIRIFVENSGKKLCRVTDNGAGIHPDDFLLSIAQHATSKITTIRDLDTIQTLGFRGEALASISAVSRFTLISRQTDKEAFQLKYPTGIEPASHPIGTTIQVEDLFYNVPARQKFLRSDATEWHHIEELVTHMALAATHVSFFLTHQGKLIRTLPALPQNKDLKIRLLPILGQSFLDQAQEIFSETVDCTLWGYIAHPVYARNQTDQQYFYVNGRMVKDKLLQHAVRQAYENKLYPGKHAAYVLYLTLPPAMVDVNVHPTKQEVRFHEARLVHDFIAARIGEALNLTKKNYPASLPLSLEQTHEIPYSENNTAPPLEFLTLLDSRVMVLKTNSQGLTFIKASHAFACLAYFYYENALKEKKSCAFSFVEPISLKIKQEEQQLLQTHEHLLIQLGFEYRCIGDKEWMCCAAPVFLQRQPFETLFPVLISALKETNTPTHLSVMRFLCRHAVALYPHQISLSEAKQLLEELARLPQALPEQIGIVLSTQWDVSVL